MENIFNSKEKQTKLRNSLNALQERITIKGTPNLAKNVLNFIQDHSLSNTKANIKKFNYYYFSRKIVGINHMQARRAFALLGYPLIGKYVLTNKDENIFNEYVRSRTVIDMDL
jgi:hypothetical protein